MRIPEPPKKMIDPTSVTPKGVTPCSSGMTATGSHGYFYSLRGAQPRGEGFPQKPLPLTSRGRTLPPSRLAPSHLPLHAGRQTQKYGAGFSESSPLLLERVAPEGPGVEGTIYNSRTARKDVRPHIRHGLRPMTPSPQGEGFPQEPLLPTPNDRTLPPAPSVPPPSRREARDCTSQFLRMKFERAGHAAAPTLRNDTAYRPSSVTG